MSSRIRKTFSIKVVLIGMAFVGAFLASYLSIRSESLNQLAVVAEFVSRGGDYHTHKQLPFRFGRWFGFEYPFDEIRVVKGPGRGDYWGMPGWECTNEDIRLLSGFKNVESIHFSNSAFGDSAIQKIAALPKLQTIEFFNCDLSECNLAIFADCGSLRTIDLNCSRCENECIENLRRTAPHIDIREYGE
ncbi:MAG: hypothetical protein AAFN77_11990 [Planctomycetota bacterium]